MSRTPTVATAFGVVFMSVIIAAFMTALVSLLLDPESGQKFLVYTSIFVGQGFMAVPLLVYLHRNNFPFVSTLRLNRINREEIAATILITLGAVFISEELDMIMEMILGQPETVDQIGEFLKVESFMGGLILFIGVGIFAPIGEELLFRGYLQHFLEKFWKDITRAVLVAALTFAIVHMNPYWIIQAYLMGVLLGYLTWRTNSVFPAIISHGVYNSLALLTSNLYSSEPAFYHWHNHVSPLWLLIAAGLTAAGFYMLHHQSEIKS